jgi:hypothetical protein
MLMVLSSFRADLARKLNMPLLRVSIPVYLGETGLRPDRYGRFWNSNEKAGVLSISKG